MKRIRFLILLIITIIVGQCYASKEVEQIKKMCGFGVEDDVVGLVVTSENCTNFATEINDFELFLTKNKINYFYLVGNLREAEKYFYFTTKLGLDTTNRNIITNMNLYNFVSKGKGYPLVVSIKRFTITQTETLGDFLSRNISLFKNISPIDSVVISETDFMVHQSAVMYNLDLEKLILVDNFYHNVFVLNPHTGNVLDRLNMSEEHIKKCYALIDPEFVKWHVRHLVDSLNPNLLSDELEYGTVKVQHDLVYLTMRLKTFSLISENNVAHEKIDFLLVLSPSLKLVHCYNIPRIPDQYGCYNSITGISSSSGISESNELTLRILCEDEIEGRYPLFATYKIEKSKLDFVGFSAMNLPQEYIENKIYYNYLMHSQINFMHRKIVILNFLPYLFDLETGEIITQLKNCSYTDEGFKNPLSEIKANFRFQSNSCYIDEVSSMLKVLSIHLDTGKYYLHTFDDSFSEVSRKELVGLNANHALTLISGGGNVVYYIHSQHEKQYLMKFNTVL